MMKFFEEKRMMKKSIAFLLALVLMLSLAACGASQPQSQPEMEAPEQNDAPAEEETLSPREEFEQKKKEMEELLNNDDEDAAAEPVTYTTNGLTYTLDSSFTPPNVAEDNFQHAYYNGIMYVTEQKMSNVFGVYTAKELAETIAAQKESRVVGEANGVYYIEDATLGAINAYYVDDSGFYWILSSTCSKFDTYREQMIQFCTSGKLN